MTYKYGDSFNKAGGEITVNTRGGTSFDLSMTDGSVSVSGYNSMPTTLPNTQNLSVSYAGIAASTTIPVTVQNYVSEIIIAAPTKTIYQCGEALDYTGGYYAVKYGNGTFGTSFDLDSSCVTGYNPSKIGTQTTKLISGTKTLTSTPPKKISRCQISI